MADLAQLQVQLELQTAAFQAGVKQVDSRLKRMDKNVQNTSKSFRGMETGLNSLKTNLLAIGTAMAAAFTVQSLKGIVEFGNNLSITAEKLGVTVEALQGLRVAAEDFGVSAQSADTALQRFSRRSAEARKGMGTLAKVYKDLNISLIGSNGAYKSSQELLDEFAKALQNTRDPAERLRLSMAAFDTEGVAFGQALAQAGASIDGFTDAAQSANRVMSGDIADSAKLVSQGVGEITDAFRNLVSSGALAILDDILSAFNRPIRKSSMIAILEEANAEVERLNERIAAMYSSGFSVDDPRLVATRENLQKAIIEQTKFEHQAREMGIELNKTNEVVDETVVVLEKLTSVMVRTKKRALEPSVQATLDYHKKMDALAESFRRAVDPVYVFQNTLADLDTLLNEGRISWEVYADAVFSAQDVLDRAAGGSTKMGDEVESLGERIKTVADGWAESFSTDLVASLKTGENAFKSFAKTVLEQLAKIAIQAALTPFFDSFGSAVGGMFGGAGGAGPKTRALIPADSTTRIGESHVGKMTSPSYGAMGHSPKGSNSGVKITVNNNSKAQVGVRESQGPNGMEIEFMIEEAVNKQLNSGAYDSTMQSRFGVNRRGY